MGVEIIGLIQPTWDKIKHAQLYTGWIRYGLKQVYLRIFERRYPGFPRPCSHYYPGLQYPIAMQLINQNSYILLAGLILALAGFFLFRKSLRPGSLALFVALTAGLIMLWFFIRPERGVDLSRAEILAMIGADTPVLLEFQSQY